MKATKEMIAAGAEAARKYMEEAGGNNPAVIWDAMWAAQPKEPEQEPVGEAYLCDRCNTPFDGAYECPSCGHNQATKEPVYTTPPQRKPLTDEEIGAILEGVNAYGTRLYTFARAIEAKLKEKNT